MIDTRVPKSILAHLLVASWHRYCRSWSTLHLVLVGEDVELESLAKKLGVQIHHRTAHTASCQRPVVNKMLAAGVAFSSQAKVILLDWDVVFTADPWMLRAIPTGRFAARIASALRVPPSLQQWVVSRFNLPVGINVAIGVLGHHWLLHHSLEGLNKDDFLRSFRYFNAGVLVFPPGRFQSTLTHWQSTQNELIRLLPEAAMASSETAAMENLAKSDQLALAITLANQPVCGLDASHNFMLFDFAEGLSSQEVAILHLVGELDNSLLEKNYPKKDLVLNLFDQRITHLLHNYPVKLAEHGRFDPGHLRQLLEKLMEEYHLFQPQ
ncbi:MAG: hypothetical protein G8345_17360 [Magnetococcales bacterium]|nr:hypothetical protein [Magnetococcales bacterium]NGZ28647.1 hypothetical protein [Magnetococcales bacterium]